MTPDEAARAKERKRVLRSELIALRARLPHDARAAAAREIAARLEEVPAWREARVVALYAPLGTEVDSGELARRVLARGGRVAYPRVEQGSRVLTFCESAPGDLVKGPLGAREPPDGARVVAREDVGCVILPGVAFSLDGLRLGRGGGYYDATLKAMPGASRIAVAYDLQLLPELPREPHDAPLDVIVTEARTLAFPRECR